jgi:hypothetical protein
VCNRPSHHLVILDRENQLQIRKVWHFKGVLLPLKTN